MYGSFASLEEEYTPKYCLELQAAYGSGMMSEGGVEGIEYMFNSIALNNKVALDIGSGLGGVAFYLADKYCMHITGLEVNPWMVAYSKKQTPGHLRGKVDFFLSTSNVLWPFASDTYDIIYSKGVLTHVELKDGIFQECYRLLKKEGLLVITDWLSSEDGMWGENILGLMELEKLALFPETKSRYVDLLKKSGFRVLSVRDDSFVYHRFNEEIVRRLERGFTSCFNEEELKASIEGYNRIIKALKVGELKVFRFVAQKV